MFNMCESMGVCMLKNGRSQSARFPRHATSYMHDRTLTIICCRKPGSKLEDFVTFNDHSDICMCMYHDDINIKYTYIHTYMHTYIHTKYKYMQILYIPCICTHTFIQNIYIVIRKYQEHMFIFFFFFF